MLKAMSSLSSPTLTRSRVSRLSVWSVGRWKRLTVVCVFLSAATVAFLATSAFAAKPEIEVLTKQGIPSARAEQALALQGRVAEAKLGRRVIAVLGDAYAGVWFEPAAAKFHVGVTSSASKRAVKRLTEEAGLAADVVETPVRSTWGALIEGQSDWNASHQELLAGGDMSTAIDPEHNAVSVRLSASISPTERVALKGEAAKAPVNVLIRVERESKLGVVPEARATCERTFTVGLAYCEEAVTAGVGIGVESAAPVCTAGPELMEGTETWMLTAGHCLGGETEGESFGAKEVTSAFPRGAEANRLKLIGNHGTRYYNRLRDMGEVRVIPRAEGGLFAEALPTPVPALVTEWEISPERPHAVEGVAAVEEPVQRQTVCHQGITTGEKCGVVLALNVASETSEHTVETSACSAPGDSGGPYFTRARTGLLMVGMHVGRPARGAPGCGEANPRANFEPLLGLPRVEEYSILVTFEGQSLLTTANETRRIAVGPTLLFLGSEGPTVLINISPTKENAHKALVIASALKSTSATLESKQVAFGFTVLAEGGRVEGIYSAKFYETEKAGTGVCETEGAAEKGEIEVGEKGKAERAKLIYIKTGAPLEVGILFEIGSLKVICNKTLEVTVKGSLLGSLAPLNKQIESGSNTIESSISCKETGVPTKTKYINQEGKEATAELSVKAGGVTAKACELIGTKENEVIKLLPNKMVEIMG
jgi:hypothetical protein